MKHLKHLLCLSALALSAIIANAADNTMNITTQQGKKVTVTAITDNIIRVTNAPAGQTLPASRAAVLSDPTANAKITTLSPTLQALTTATGVVVTANTSTGEVIINAGPGKTVIDDGTRAFAPGEQTLTLNTTAKGSYYGAGERGHKINLRGDTLTMYNRQNYGYTGTDPRINQMNITMPLFISSDGFALLFDDYAAAEMILGRDSQIKYITESSVPVSYYFINGTSTIADVSRELSALTGRQPLPPLWALGYITSKYGYHNEKETLGCIDSLKTRGYPVDGIVLDLYWYGKEQDMGRLAWEPEQWPDAEKMLKKLADENVHLVAISQPYVLRNGKALDNYNLLAQEGMLVADSTGKKPQEVVIWVGEGGMFDMSNPDTKAWLRNRYKQLTDMGISGWWGDLGEPEVHPESGMHANGLKARLYHNQYGNDWSEIIANLFAEEYPDTRLLTMMRGGTTGLQRYSVFPWSTDVSRSWGGLQPQITIMLNSGLSGLGYMGHDVGGFAIDPENPIDPELYVRWLQLGLFSPMLRTHAQYNAEPYHYPQYASIILPLIKERYQWLPYNYTLAYENAKYGYPLVRPLNFFEPGNNAYDEIIDEYLWGPELLVAPVITQGAVSRQVTFPQGTWVDYNNPRNKYAGGTTIDYPAPLEVLPLFVKAGSFIPLADYKMSSTADYDPSRLTVKYFPVEGVETIYSFYDDDRKSPSALTDGAYRLITFTGDETQGNISVNITSEGTYPSAPATVTMTMAVEGLTGAPASVTVNGKKVKTRYAAATGTLTFAVKFQPGTPTNILIAK